MTLFMNILNKGKEEGDKINGLKKQIRKINRKIRKKLNRKLA